MSASASSPESPSSPKRVSSPALDNLRDLTLNPAYSSICGYTENDLDRVFASELPGLDRGKIRDWYKGYSWGGEERVYNPCDVLLLLADREFKAWWCETGSPKFLVDTLVRRGVPSAALDGMLATEKLLGSFDVGRIATEALLFQIGYLTIRSREDRGGKHFYRLATRPVKCARASTRACSNT